MDVCIKTFPNAFSLGLFTPFVKNFNHSPLTDYLKSYDSNAYSRLVFSYLNYVLPWLAFAFLLTVCAIICCCQDSNRTTNQDCQDCIYSKSGFESVFYLAHLTTLLVVLTSVTVALFGVQSNLMISRSLCSYKQLFVGLIDGQFNSGNSALNFIGFNKIDYRAEKFYDNLVMHYSQIQTASLTFSMPVNNLNNIINPNKPICLNFTLEDPQTTNTIFVQELKDICTNIIAQVNNWTTTLQAASKISTLIYTSYDPLNTNLISYLSTLKQLSPMSLTLANKSNRIKLQLMKYQNLVTYLINSVLLLMVTLALLSALITSTVLVLNTVFKKFDLLYIIRALWITSLVNAIIFAVVTAAYFLSFAVTAQTCTAVPQILQYPIRYSRFIEQLSQEAFQCLFAPGKTLFAIAGIGLSSGQTTILQDLAAMSTYKNHLTNLQSYSQADQYLKKIDDYLAFPQKLPDVRAKSVIDSLNQLTLAGSSYKQNKAGCSAMDIKYAFNPINCSDRPLIKYNINVMSNTPLCAIVNTQSTLCPTARPLCLASPYIDNNNTIHNSIVSLYSSSPNCGPIQSQFNRIYNQLSRFALSTGYRLANIGSNLLQYIKEYRQQYFNLKYFAFDNVQDRLNIVSQSADYISNGVSCSYLSAKLQNINVTVCETGEHLLVLCIVLIAANLVLALQSMVLFWLTSRVQQFEWREGYLSLLELQDRLRKQHS